MAVLAAIGVGTPGSAATLTVGPDQAYKTPDEAAELASPGDTILISAGTYHACAVWRTDNLTIVGLGSGPLFSGTICEGKGIFVVQGNDITIRNIKFADAMNDRGNGAGIRAQGVNLSIEDSVFTNDQDGILADRQERSTIVIRNSVFDGDGACASPPDCAHGIYIGHIALLHVERTRFLNTMVGHHIKSRALRTEILDNTIEDGRGGTSSYLVDIPNGGTLVMTGNVLEKGSKSDNHETAVDIGEEGKFQPSDELLIEKNIFTNDGPPTAFVRNATPTPVRLVDNIIKGNAAVALVGPGTVR